MRSLRQHLPYNRQPRIMIISNELTPEKAQANGRGLHSFPFQLNLSSSVHRLTQLDS